MLGHYTSGPPILLDGLPEHVDPGEELLHWPSTPTPIASSQSKSTVGRAGPAHRASSAEVNTIATPGLTP